MSVQVLARSTPTRRSLSATTGRGPVGPAWEGNDFDPRRGPSAVTETGSDRTSTIVIKFVGVYDADGGIAGEAKYVVGHLLGHLHCALCDITHGPVRRKKSFDAFRARLRVPFDVVHRNERSPEVEAATGDALPSVVAVTDSGIVTLLDRAALEGCGGEVGQLEAALHTAIVDRQVWLPSH